MTEPRPLEPDEIRFLLSYWLDIGPAGEPLVGDGTALIALRMPAVARTVAGLPPTDIVERISEDTLAAGTDIRAAWWAAQGSKADPAQYADDERAIRDVALRLVELGGDLPGASS